MTLLFHCVRHQKKLFLIYQIHVVMIHGQFSMTHWRLTFQATFPCSLKGKNINRQLIKSYQNLFNETRNLQVKKYYAFVINNSIVLINVIWVSWNIYDIYKTRSKYYGICSYMNFPPFDVGWVSLWYDIQPMYHCYSRINSISWSLYYK